MSPPPTDLRALLVDDDGSVLTRLVGFLAEQGFSTVDPARSLEEARAALSRSTYDLVLLDLALPDGDGTEILTRVSGEPCPDVVVISADASTEAARAALRRGAADYLTKPIDLDRLEAILLGLQRARDLRRRVQRLQDELKRSGHLGGLVGASPPMQDLFDLIARVATTPSTVFIIGETGTGKELVARTVHELSPRSNGPFLPVNCGAIAPTLVESELFGHEKGSFTGATKRHQGIFERADGGTLFLDEITEMPDTLQVKLLRTLETGTIRRVGSSEALETNVRVIAATNRDPESAVGAEDLRRDLYYRLNVFPLRVPPLRERGDDVELLARHFLARLNEKSGMVKRLADSAVQHLRARDWPGNVRELRNVVERAYIIADLVLDTDCLPVDDSVGSTPRAPGGESITIPLGVSTAEAERRLILATLDWVEGDKKKAAAQLGISLKTLYNRLKVYRARSDEDD